MRCAVQSQNIERWPNCSRATASRERINEMNESAAKLVFLNFSPHGLPIERQYLTKN